MSRVLSQESSLRTVAGARTDPTAFLFVQCPYCGVRGEVFGPGTATCGYCGSDFDVVAA